MRRFVLLFVLPGALVLTLAIAPLVGGGRTLFLRDVFNTHLPMKHAEAEALRAGRLPLVDPYRAGGQPLLGNPNAVPLYPDNVLYLLASDLWALNAHFWLHLLIAPFAMAWLARRLGLAREAAWAAGIVYGTSGYVLSNLNFYNLIAGVALAPALIAAALEATGERPRRGLILTGLLWALLLLAGEPLLAGLALLLALGALWIRPVEWRALGGLALAILAGTLLAAPQWVELLRILPLSFRGHFGYSAASSTVESFDPRQVLEWLLPLPFGRLDSLGAGMFWGSQFYTGRPPYYLALYPGLLVFGWLAAAGRPAGRRLALWAWASVAVGVFFALGRFNPLAAFAFRAGALRYPIKLWLLVAIGGSVLCGIGYERTAAPDDAGARRRQNVALATVAGFLALLWLALALRPEAMQALLRRVVPASFPDAFVAHERLRWAGLCLISLVVLAALFGLLRLARHRPAWAGLLLAAHAAAQLWLLRPLYPMDDAAPYREPPALLADVPGDAPVVQGSFLDLFGENRITDGSFAEPDLRFVERRAFAELYPAAGTLWGRRYELDCSAEGLDSFLARVAQGAVAQLDDERRMLLLQAWGVGRLLLDRPLEPPADGHARLVRGLPSYGRELYVYAVESPWPAAFLATRVRYAPDINAAVAALTRRDPAAGPLAVLPGSGAPRDVAPGTVVVERQDAESFVAQVEAPAGGVLVVQRSHLPLWRARLDGAEVPLLAANLYRMGVEVPPGSHRVTLAVDRTPLRWGFALAALGALGLLFVARARPEGP
ncbi:MAG: hypothetical protein ACM3OB_10050 [Acidobacteriota bacterium]